MRSLPLGRLLFFLTILWVTLGTTGCVQPKDVRIKDARLADVQRTQGDDNGFDVSIGVRIYNPNNFQIKVVKSDLDLLLGDHKVGSAQLKEKVKIPKNSDEEHIFRVHTTLKEVASGLPSAVLNVLQKRQLPLRVKGTIKARSFLIFSKTFEVDHTQRVGEGLLGQ